MLGRRGLRRGAGGAAARRRTRGAGPGPRRRSCALGLSDRPINPGVLQPMTCTPWPGFWVSAPSSWLALPCCWPGATAWRWLCAASWRWVAGLFRVRNPKLVRCWRCWALSVRLAWRAPLHGVHSADHLPTVARPRNLSLAAGRRSLHTSPASVHQGRTAMPGRSLVHSGPYGLTPACSRPR